MAAVSTAPCTWSRMTQEMEQPWLATTEGTDMTVRQQGVRPAAAAAAVGADGVMSQLTAVGRSHQGLRLRLVSIL